eukprot:RCo025248
MDLLLPAPQLRLRVWPWGGEGVAPSIVGTPRASRCRSTVASLTNLREVGRPAEKLIGADRTSGDASGSLDRSGVAGRKRVPGDPGTTVADDSDTDDNGSDGAAEEEEDDAEEEEDTAPPEEEYEARGGEEAAVATAARSGEAKAVRGAAAPGTRGRQGVGKGVVVEVVVGEQS